MRLIIDTATGSGAISALTERVKSIEFHARSDNAASVVVGTSDVSASKGRELPPGESVTINFDESSEPLSVCYVNVGSGDAVDWIAITR